MSTIITATCGRCGGSGEYSFNHMDGTRCYGCGGTGKVAKAPKGQKKIRPTAEVNTATVGDIILHKKVLYRVDRITWMHPIKKGWVTYNQALHVTRLVDSETFKMHRECMKESPNTSAYSYRDGKHFLSFSYTAYEPAEDEIGQDTTVSKVYMTEAEEQESIATFFEWKPELVSAEIVVRERL
jgi:hypothetical protein